jgi:hypothetical protein
MNVMIQTQTSVSDYLGYDDMPHAMAQWAAVTLTVSVVFCKLFIDILSCH